MQVATALLLELFAESKGKYHETVGSCGKVSSRYRIMVADDDPEMLRYYLVTLEQLGHEVVGQASDGTGLVVACRELRPDLVISDVEMPGSDGVSAMELVHRSDRVPVVFVTACDDPTLRHRAESNECVAYLIKPIKRLDLVAALGLTDHYFSHSRHNVRASAGEFDN